MIATTTTFQTSKKPPACQISRLQPARTSLLQRKCACGGTPGPTGECEKCRKKREAGMLRRKVAQPSTLSEQRSEVPPVVHEVLRSPGQPLDAETRAFMEPHFGHDFSSVKLHTDTRAAESARAVHALAYTVGQNVVFGQGQYSPRTSNGQRLMVHELAHTVQQSRGGDPSLSGSMRVSEASDADEREAEAVAEKVVAGGSNETGVANIHPATSAIQRIGDPTKVPPGLELECEIASDSPASTSEDLLFGNKISTLSALQQAQIDNFVLNWRAAGGNAPVRVDGYASKPGTDELNWRLSCDRAQAVAAELARPSSKIAGIPAGSIRTVAHGETTEFVADAQNRRATISSATKPSSGQAKSLTVVSWINPDGLPDFSEVDIGLTPPALRPLEAVAMILKCTANRRPPRSLRGSELESFKTTKEFRGIQHYSLNIGSGAQTPGNALQLVGYTAPSKCGDVPPSDYLQGEASPLSYSIAEPNKFEGLMKFRVSAAEEAAAISARPNVPVGLGGLSLDMLPRVPWVWTEARGSFYPPGSSELHWFVTGSAFPTHTIYVDGKQVAEIPQQRPGVLLGPGVRTADKPRQTRAEEEAQREIVLSHQKETVHPGDAASGID